MAHDNDYHMDQLVEIEFEGMPYWVMPRYIHHYVHNNYEKFSLKLIRNYIKPGDTFLDIGAHYGAYAVYAASKCQASVIALEPVNENFEILGKNVAVNNLDRTIELHNVAASDKDGEAEFNIPWASDSAGFYEHPLAETYKKQKVAVRNVDGLVGRRKIDFIKIDTEGHELAVLAGLKKTLARNPDVKMLIEANPSCLESAGHTITELLEYLATVSEKELYAVNESSFTLHRITDDIANWQKYVDGYANILCLPKKQSGFGLFICHSSAQGGGELALVEAVLALRERGVQSHVVVPNLGPVQEILEERGISHSVYGYHYWLDQEEDRSARNTRNIESSAQIAQLAEAINPTFVANNSMVCPWGTTAARQLGLPLMWFVHEFGDLDHDMAFPYPISTVRSYISQQADVVVCCSDAVASKFKGNNIEVLYPMLGLDEGIVELSKHTTGPVFSQKATLKICVVGRVQKSKGQLQVVQALAELRGRSIDAELAIVGSGEPEYIAQIEDEIKRHGLSGVVTMTGHQPNPYAIVAQADVVVVSSKSEAFGRVTVEAMTLGRPVVGANSGGTAELIINDKTGLLYEPGDANQLAEQLTKLTKRSMRQSLSLAASRELANRIRPKGGVDALLKIINELDYGKDRSLGIVLLPEMTEAICQSAHDKQFLRTQVADNIAVREAIEQELAEVKDYAERVAADRDALLKSNSWKVTRPVRVVGRYGKKLRNLPRKLQLQRETELFELQYEAQLTDLKSFKRRSNVTLAVIVHLFYGESWPAIKQRLTILDEATDFDLFLTVPNRAKVPDDVLESFPAAQIVEVPNRGRDVLPFVMVAPILAELGYEYFVKAHSKRSTHYAGGADWFASIMRNLIPDSVDAVKATVAKLGSPDVGVISPVGEYISLIVNYRSNRHHIGGILADVTSIEQQRAVDRRPHDYGFVAGTMFWGRFDALGSILRQGYGVRNFEAEQGQIDATFAHALERVFTVVPELNGRDIYEVGPEGVMKLKYPTDNIPEWSDEGPRTGSSSSKQT